MKIMILWKRFLMVELWRIELLSKKFQKNYRLPKLRINPYFMGFIKCLDMRK